MAFFFFFSNEEECIGFNLFKISKFYQPKNIRILPEVPEYGSLDVEGFF